MPLISLREFARRNSVSAEAISRAVKAGRLPQVDGKIDPEQAQPIWDAIKDQTRAGRKLGPRGRQLAQVDTQNRQVGTPNRQVDRPERQVDSQVDTYQPPRTIAVTFRVNGAEWLELDTGSRDAGLTIPARVRMQCGLSAWITRGTEMAGRTSSGRRPTLALERRSITITLTDEEREQLRAGACRSGINTLAQYIRTRCGFQVRHASLPGTDEREDEADDAWERLKRLGLDPKDYFSQD